ncbi:hypothetical protein [Mesorhizobium sp. LNJC394B00]|uniref:hypothetical protein n=1 Tax=Mesorhizobium sp. LNJC394B00 TaxID=1287274 RepID=UPI0012EB82CE|nr:hypothetical protein [Mesorhizobium sp. LNJC394B00]
MSLILAALGLLAASCAALPNADKVKGFGEAASSSSTVMKDALNTNRLVALKTSREREADAYITGRSYLLRMDDRDKEMLLDAKEQVAVLAALDQYAKALVKAADQGVINELEAASSRLGTAAGTIGSAIAPTAAPVIGPALKLSGRVVGLGLGNAYAAEIQSIVRATDPTIQQIAETMPISLSTIATVASAQAEGFEVQRQITLDTIRRDPKVDRLTLYKEYMVARGEVETTDTQINALVSSAGIFDQLAKAHGALAKGSPDAAILVKQFAATSSELAELIKAVRNTQGS